jgi:hypothetical protein
VNDEKVDLLADSQNILNRWKNYFSQLLNVLNVSDVRQVEVYTAEFYPCGVLPVALCILIPFKYTCNRN